MLPKECPLLNRVAGTLAMLVFLRPEIARAEEWINRLQCRTVHDVNACRVRTSWHEWRLLQAPASSLPLDRVAAAMATHIERTALGVPDHAEFACLSVSTDPAGGWYVVTPVGATDAAAGDLFLYVNPHGRPSWRDVGTSYRNCAGG